MRAEYGKVVMHFNQSGYLHRLDKKDTVVVTPKYFSDDDIARLLKKGKVKIIRRSDDQTETRITQFLIPNQLSN